MVSTTSDEITMVCSQTGLVRVVETTYLVRPLSLVATRLSGSVTWRQ